MPSGPGSLSHETFPPKVALFMQINLNYAAYGSRGRNHEFKQFGETKVTPGGRRTCSTKYNELPTLLPPPG